MKRKIFLSLSIVLTGLFVGTSLWIQNRDQKELPILGAVLPFSLVNQHSKDIGLEDLLGYVWVADFIFTTCSGPCPILSEHMAQLHRSYQLDDRVRLVSISVNPETDTPDVLLKYAGKYKADVQRWYFLTGDREEIHRLSYKGFKVGSVDEPVFHSTSMILVDESGQIRGYYDGTDQEKVRELFFDIAKLL
ncbi:SCO family protein [PVC group bacterium]|nr:SCO family protein [PVC group bacterium]